MAERVLDADGDWAMPVLWKSEFCNILAGFLRRGDLAVEEALACLDGAETQLADSAFNVPARQVLEKVAGSDCTAYDCEYVALADELGVPLDTKDRKVLR